MATHLNDLGSATLVKSILPPQTFEGDDPEGEAADLGDGDGPCFAIQSIGDVTGDAGLTGRIEESHNGVAWVAISEAAFTPTTAAGVQVIRFLRSRRYVRWASEYDPGEGDAVTVAALVVQPKKSA